MHITSPFVESLALSRLICLQDAGSEYRQGERCGGHMFLGNGWDSRQIKGPIRGRKQAG